MDPFSGVKAATSTSQAVIAAGALGGVGFLLFQHHPQDDSSTLIDYGLAAMLTPPILLGVSTGVLLNVVFPDWLLTILLTILLIVLSYRPTRMVRVEKTSDFVFADLLGYIPQNTVYFHSKNKCLQDQSVCDFVCRINCKAFGIL